MPRPFFDEACLLADFDRACYHASLRALYAAPPAVQRAFADDAAALYVQQCMKRDRELLHPVFYYAAAAVYFSHLLPAQLRPRSRKRLYRVVERVVDEERKRRDTPASRKVGKRAR